MRRLLFQVWSLPWPASIRRALEPLALMDAVQFFAVPHFRVGVVGIIRDDRGDFLLFRHTYRREYPWGLPTGFLEHDEQPAAALHREISEEAGLTVDLDPIWNVYADSRRIINLVFRGTGTPTGFRPSAEISEAQFFSADALPALMPDQLRLVRECREKDGSHTYPA